jgi:hypothetical protein
LRINDIRVRSSAPVPDRVHGDLPPAARRVDRHRGRVSRDRRHIAPYPNEPGLEIPMLSYAPNDIRTVSRCLPASPTVAALSRTS